MLAPTLQTGALRALESLFRLGSRDVSATTERIAHDVDRPVTEIRTALAQLRRVGLVQPDRPRLTMAGLVVALAVASSETQGAARAA